MSDNLNKNIILNIDKWNYIENDDSPVIDSFSLTDVFIDSINNYDLTEFLDDYAYGIFRYHPDGNPAYFIDVDNDFISIGSTINLNYQKEYDYSDIETINNNLVDFSNDVIDVIRNNFNREYSLDSIITERLKKGIVLKAIPFDKQ